MSATGRSEAAGTGVVRHPDDFYATPEWCTRAILPHLGLQPDDIVLDPCCGDGAILRAAAGLPITLRLRGIEYDGERARVARLHGFDVSCGDALFPATDWGVPRVILTNPPFSLALDFVQKSIGEVRSTASGVGTVCFLLRLNWLASQKRAAWMRLNTPSVYVLPRRPSFTGKGTDATEYAWMVWQRGALPKVRILEVGP